jgi:hypothetical protein
MPTDQKNFGHIAQTPLGFITIDHQINQVMLLLTDGIARGQDPGAPIFGIGEV